MKHVSILLLLFGGCGSEVSDPAATRPTLAEARATCRMLGADSAGFDVLVSVLRAIRSDGATETEALLASVEICNLTPENSEECVICRTAMIAAVWR